MPFFKTFIAIFQKTVMTSRVDSNFKCECCPLELYRAQYTQPGSVSEGLLGSGARTALELVFLFEGQMKQGPDEVKQDIWER